MKSQSGLDVEVDEVQGEIEKSYDSYPYESQSFPLTHPSHLAVLATLFGMKPVNPEKCRVLELGCASGGNLIPMAMQLPGSQFFGVDLSGEQIKLGHDAIKKLKLKNVKLEHKDILKVGGNIRKFDYIICHGVYSWVPENVRSRILEICRDYLNDNGVAYISYNTYPGWHMRESIRNMMKFHVAQLDNVQDQVNQSRALLNFLSESVNEDSAYGKYLKDEVGLLSSTGDSYVAHDFLEYHNQPEYFYEFAQAADSVDLQYLAEAEFSSMLASNFPPQVAQTLQKVGQNIIQMEQYMDFVRNRTFRATLLCKKGIELDRNINADFVKQFYIASPVQPINQTGKESSDHPPEFSTPAGVRISSKSVLTQTAFRILGAAWPASLSFDELLQQAANLSGADLTQGAPILAADLLSAYTAKVIELHHQASSFVMDISDRPMASALSREQAENNITVTNQRHERTVLNEPLRQLLCQLDGKKTHEDLASVLLVLVKEGSLQINDDGKPIQDEEKLQGFAGQFLQQMLAELGRRALLIS